MNYTEALDYIHSAQKFTTKQDLSRIFNLLHEMGQPHLAPKYIHVAGTNGKGSATAMCASVLKTAGFRTGMFISPYLERFNERIQIDGVPIPDESLAAIVTDAVRHVESMCAKGLSHVTEFELLTAVAFDYWARELCDFVSLEVGMGGRLDATNVIEAPEVALIMSISHDHMKHLGESVEAIAYEKCGIIKRGSSVVCYAKQHPDALRVIESVCRERGAELIIPDAEAARVHSSDLGGTDLEYCGIRTKVPLVGRHQVWNTLSVIEAMRALARRGYAVRDGDIRRGIAATEWRGRLETVRCDPYTLIDAAHNPDATAALSAAIDTYLQGRKIVTVMGMVGDKDYEQCIPEIARRSDAFIAVTPESNRALPAAHSAAVARPHCRSVEYFDSIHDGIDRAYRLATERGAMVLVCGSLFVIGHAKTYISTLDK